MWVDDAFYKAARWAPAWSGAYGVTHYDPARCFDGYTLFSPAWGHLSFLIDMQGLVVQTWMVQRSNLGRLLPGGNLLTHSVGRWLEELRPDSSVAWRWESGADFEAVTHHDFQSDGDTVWTLAKRREPVRPGFYEPHVAPDHMLSDVVLRVDRDGEIVWQFHLSEHLDELAACLGLSWPCRYRRRRADGTVVANGPPDWAHANGLQVLPPTSLGERDVRFRAGNVLLSLRHLDTLIIVNPRQDAIVWCWGPRVLDGQHHPTLLNNGHLLVFDNGPYRGHSVVREIDPVNGETMWRYEDPGAFLSPKRGSCQRLPNGNTLICEGDSGRIFEVTQDGEIVWQYVSPFMSQGSRHMGRRIYRATRYSPQEAQQLLARRTDEIAGHRLPDGGKVTRVDELVDLYRRGWS